MKLVIAIATLCVFSSCKKIENIMDGTENLPKQIQETNDGMKKTNEAIRLQKMGVAMGHLKDKHNRSNLVPVPFGMMSAAKMLAEALTPEETVNLFKTGVSDLNKSQADTVFPQIEEEAFQHERMADYFMLILISGFLPETTVSEVIRAESDQGANQSIMLNVLRMRVYFNSDMMLYMSTLGLDANADATGNYPVLDATTKMDTLGKINKAIAYNEIVEAVCKLDFADKVDVQIEGFKMKPLDVEQAKKNWELILSRTQSDYKAESLSKDPVKNEAEVKEYAERFNALIAKLKAKTK